MTAQHDKDIRTVHSCLRYMEDNDSELSKRDRDYASYITSEMVTIYESEKAAMEASDELLMTIGDTFGYSVMDSLNPNTMDSAHAYNSVVIDGCTAELIYGNCIIDAPDNHSAAMALQNIERDLSIEQATYIVERIQEELDV